MTTAPSTPPQPAILAGLWAGAVGLSADDGRSLGVIWKAETQSDGHLSGAATLSTLPSAPAQMAFVGTMSSVLSGQQFLLTYRSDSVPTVGAGCTVSATGTAHLEDFTLVGDLDVKFQSCDALGLQRPASTRLQLLMKLD
jgi:hypothetical protein